MLFVVLLRACLDVPRPTAIRIFFSITPSSLSLQEENFFIMVDAKVLDDVPRFHGLLNCLNEWGSHHWLLVVPIYGLSRTHHIHAPLHYPLQIFCILHIFGVRLVLHR